MLLDKKASQIYRKLQCAEDDYERFMIIDQLNPDLAKRTFIRYVMNEDNANKNKQ